MTWADQMVDWRAAGKAVQMADKRVACWVVMTVVMTAVMMVVKLVALMAALMAVQTADSTVALMAGL